MLEMRILSKLFIGIFSFVAIQSAFAVGGLFVNIDDITAGESSTLRISGLIAKENIGLELVRPDNTTIHFTKQADTNGVVSTKIYALHIQKSGEYALNILRTFGLKNKITEHFTVFPGAPSAYKTKVKLEDASIVADGETAARFVVSVKDAYGNPIYSAPVRVVSSRNEDLVLYPKSSNKYGEVRGTVKSKTPGISTLSVIVGDTVIYEKPEIVFYLKNKGLNDVGAPDIGQFLKAQLFEDTEYQEISYFSIEDLPSEVLINKRYTFRVIAKDEDGNIVPNYFGKVRFASSDNQSTLPADYEFDEVDQGAHTFALSIIFGSIGEHTLTVHDTGDFRIAGEATVTVVSGKNVIDNSDEDGITILTPLPGTFRSSRVTITGKAIGTQYIKIEDGPTMLIEELEVDPGGEFVYQTPALADGTHKFRATSVDGELVSEEVTIQIDQSPPTVMLVEIKPKKSMSENEAFTINVASDEPLSAASCVLNEVKTPLTLSGDKFVGTFQAPNKCGVYPISCTIADLLGNELSEPNAEVLEVCASNSNNKVAPTAITNLSATAGEEKVTLFWSPAKDDRGVAQYRIIYGTAKTSMNQVNVTPDNRTQWYVDGLEKGRKYFFQVFALDADGQASVGSNIVEAMTLGESIHNSAPKNTPTSGGNHWIPAGMALIIGGIFFIITRRRV